MIKALFSGETISSTSEEAFTLFEKSRFGEKKQNKIVYTLVETLYLVERKKMEVYSGNKILEFELLLKKLKKLDKTVELKLNVFNDLRDKGYIVKTALKFGAELRVYDKGASIGEEHARWILYPVHEFSVLKWQEFSAKNRVAHSTKKNLLIAVVDEEKDITYYEISWIRP